MGVQWMDQKTCKSVDRHDEEDMKEKYRKILEGIT
jgi:hypothetical protein